MQDIKEKLYSRKYQYNKLHRNMMILIIAIVETNLMQYFLRKGKKKRNVKNHTVRANLSTN